MERIRGLIEWIAPSIELLDVAVIIAAIVLAAAPRMFRNAFAAGRGGDAFSGYKQRMGRGLLLGLELGATREAVARPPEPAARA